MDATDTYISLPLLKLLDHGRIDGTGKLELRLLVGELVLHVLRRLLFGFL